MLASERWAKAFKAQMECAKCRTKQGLRLYGFDKRPINLQEVTVEDLTRRLDRIDVWCRNCDPKVNRIVQGVPRQERKKEAALLAELSIKATHEGVNDSFLIEGHALTRSGLIDHFRAKPCTYCKQEFPKEVMRFYNLIRKNRTAEHMIYDQWSLEDILTHLEESVILCSNCSIMAENGYIGIDTFMRIVLDNAEWEVILTKDVTKTA